MDACAVAFNSMPAAHPTGLLVMLRFYSGSLRSRAFVVPKLEASATIKRTESAVYLSPGQRPGYWINANGVALKGQYKM